ncbi:tRNA (guanosine(37)-N1)-methyltransferase TrmD [Boudabousia marimammalium]|uniref:tRNA (guanine-N(1)-)-methyltransferase n=1 Tax=Boudabousia marimammalium TaxID=156892 RepID=A0A1Q5PRU0_9ACTO|nr:tRNA (guanosine(37)-N1)-methyltransferase TrmD [Boudabousia marimammalium]OKL50130.1 tRNA (guanosine(37)-N1)-methyltransferase TrmD [Boudabousia marimammalium]
MRIDILTIFPEFFDSLELSLMGKAQESGALAIKAHNLRDWTHDRHRTVDDSPYGGGAGMVMRVDVWTRALTDVLNSSAIKGRRVVMIPTPSGRPLTQTLAENLATADQLIFACGRYEGIDARFAELVAQDSAVELCEFSLGDYVLNGGEAATLVAIEAVGRLVPDVVGNAESLVEESHGQSGLLEYPVYTRPLDFSGAQVPQVLLSGDHEAVARWRHLKSLERTAQVRADLLQPGGKAHDSLSVLDRERLLAWQVSPDAGQVRLQEMDYAGGQCFQLTHQRGALSRSAAVVIWGPREAHPQHPHEALKHGFVIIGARPDLGAENELVGSTLLLAEEYAEKLGVSAALMRMPADKLTQAWAKERGWKKAPQGLGKVLRHADLRVPGQEEPRSVWFYRQLS